MGRGIVKNLVTEGNLSSSLIINNRTTSKLESLSDSLLDQFYHVKIASTVSEAVSLADIIFTYLRDDAVV